MSLFIGLMSGTSMDAVDAALVAFTGDKAQLSSFTSYPFPKICVQIQSSFVILGSPYCWKTMDASVSG
jgi:1,6-anhydro-N-acetylmuramate kinase